MKPASTVPKFEIHQRQSMISQRKRHATSVTGRHHNLSKQEIATSPDSLTEMQETPGGAGGGQLATSALTFGSTSQRRETTTDFAKTSQDSVRLPPDGLQDLKQVSRGGEDQAITEVSLQEMIEEDSPASGLQAREELVLNTTRAAAVVT